MPTGEELLERHDALRRIRGSLTAAAQGSGRVVMIEGEPGIGKTALLRAGLEEARERGFQTVSARGGVLERSLGHGVARDLFEPALLRAPAAERRVLLAGPAAVADSALGAARHRGRLSEGQVHHGLYWLASNLAERAPLLIAVDDCQWCDDATLRWLLYLTRRLEQLPIAAVLAARRGEPGGPDDVLALIVSEPVCEVLELNRLSEPATVALLERTLGGPADPTFGRACQAWTGGIPFMVQELASELLAESIEPSYESVDRMRRLNPGAVSRSVLLRLSRLPREAAALAGAVSLLGDGTSLFQAAEFAGLEESQRHDAADALVSARILEPGQPLRFVHPLLSGVIYGDLPPARRAAEHRRAARLLAEGGGAVERIAAHLLRSAPAGDPWVVEQLRAAAAGDLARGAPEAAIEHLRRALEEPPPSAMHPALLYELGQAESLIRDPRALADLQAALGETEDPSLRARVAELLLELLVLAGAWDHALRLVEAALHELGDRDREATVRLEAWRSAVTAYDPQFVDQYNRRLPQLRALVAAGGPAARMLALLLAAVGALRGEPAREVLELVDQGLDQGRLVAGEGAGLWPAQALTALMAIDELDRARMVAEEILADASRRGSVVNGSAGLSFRGWAYAQAGDLVRAEADLRAGYELAREHELTFAVPSILLYASPLVGERSGLSDLAALAAEVSLPPAFLRTASGGLLLTARARGRLAAGDREAAIDDLRRCGATFDALALRNPVFLPWRSMLALALRDSAIAEARALASQELEIATALAFPRAEGVALRALGLIEGGEQGHELLAESTRALARSPARLEHARSLVEHGAALRRAGRRIDAREPLHEGLAMAERCGAERLTERAREEMRATGARPRSSPRDGVAALTPAELRVCRMAIDGMTNPEIAHALFVSRGTVESQLHSAYMKLDVSSRRELASRIRDP